MLPGPSLMFCPRMQSIPTHHLGGGVFSPAFIQPANTYRAPTACQGLCKETWALEGRTQASCVPSTTLPAGPWEEASASKSGERDWCPPLPLAAVAHTPSCVHTCLCASVCVHTCVLLGRSSGVWVSLGRACPLGSRLSMVRPSLTVPGRNTKSERWAPKNRSPPSGRL